jgi:hypothetical protein
VTARGANGNSPLWFRVRWWTDDHDDPVTNFSRFRGSCPDKGIIEGTFICQSLGWPIDPDYLGPLSFTRSPDRTGGSWGGDLEPGGQPAFYESKINGVKPVQRDGEE